MKMFGKCLIAAAALISLLASAAVAAEVEVLWLGHATTRITSTTGKVILIDPFLTKNPKTPAEYKDLKALGKVDLILITHGHMDHVRDLKELAALSGAKVVAAYAFAHNSAALGVVAKDKVIGMNKGGTVTPLGPDIKIHMVPAEHASAIDTGVPGYGDADAGKIRFIEGGVPVGYVVELENGFKVYHSGDTAVFGDMALIHEFYKPDLALVSIGGHFTMGPAGAAYAVTNLLKPKQVIPIHYGTFGLLKGTPAELKQAMGNSPIKVLNVSPGQAVKF